jgi:hypothetical protein
LTSFKVDCHGIGIERGLVVSCHHISDTSCIDTACYTSYVDHGFYDQYMGLGVTRELGPLAPGSVIMRIVELARGHARTHPCHVISSRSGCESGARLVKLFQPGAAPQVDTGQDGRSPGCLPGCLAECFAYIACTVFSPRKVMTRMHHMAFTVPECQCCTVCVSFHVVKTTLSASITTRSCMAPLGCRRRQLHYTRGRRRASCDDE